jgi:hypothetical protein
MAETRYYLDKDDSGHRFLVPCERKEDFRKWVEIVENEPENVEGWKEPDYVRRIEGDLTFERPMIFGKNPWAKNNPST